jgi:hypothetical protein
MVCQYFIPLEFDGGLGSATIGGIGGDPYIYVPWSHPIRTRHVHLLTQSKTVPLTTLIITYL